MSLDDFSSNNSDTDTSNSNANDSFIKVSDCFLHTPCKCDISDVYTFEIPVDELDIIGHLQAEHGKSFKQAAKEVKRLQKLKK